MNVNKIKEIKFREIKNYSIVILLLLIVISSSIYIYSLGYRVVVNGTATAEEDERVKVLSDSWVNAMTEIEYTLHNNCKVICLKYHAGYAGGLSCNWGNVTC